MLVPSPASLDFAIADEYAKFLQTQGKDYSRVHSGARWELACSRLFGTTAYRDCVRHLQRASSANIPRDFEYDFIAGRLRIDPKVTETRENANLIVTTPRRNVVYTLGISHSAFPLKTDTPYDMMFEFAGWSPGDPSLFRPLTHINGNPLGRLRTDLKPPQLLLFMVMHDVSVF